ncbi:hypothetical protein [Streptomyces cyaneofuscatus]|uniref:hypothetical protein n=1 Tax=Streptomyces cyaneofuscatus TaxID=66883 RepID=UPI00341BFC14
MSMAELVAAGAPELPEGHFYRVSSAMITGYVRVSIRRARLVGSVHVEAAVVAMYRHSDELEAVVFGCRTAYQWWQEKEESTELAQRVQALYGDHDPRGGRR